MQDMLKKLLIPTAVIIVIVLIGGAFLLGQKGILFKSGFSGQEVAEKVIKYISDNGGTASLVSITDKGGVYEIRLKIGSQEYDTYATKDGTLLFPEGYSLSATSTQNDASTEVEKKDTPDVKLFIM